MRRRSLAAAAASVAVATAATGPALGASREPWRVQALPVGASYAEPGLAAGAHGQLLANACTANAGGPATFWRSSDAGRAWSRGFTIGASAIGCGDADTAIGSDGYAYALVLGTGVSVYRSRDGRTWSGPATFPPPHGEDQPDRPWLVPVPTQPNVVHVFNSEVGGNIVEWTSTDHAATFTGPVRVTAGLNSQAALTLGSRPLVDPRNPDRMEMFYETASWTGVLPSVADVAPDQFPLTQLWEATSSDGGRSWNNTMMLDVTTTFHQSSGTLGHLLPATTIDVVGTTYVVLSVQLGSSTATHLYLMHASSGGRWSAPARIDRVGSSNVYPAIAVARPGHVFIGWYGSTAASFDDSAARWRENVAETSDALAPHPTFTSTTFAPLVHVGAIEQAGAVGNDLGEDWSLRDFQSVVVDSCGAPHVAWASDAGGRGRVLTATKGC